MFWLALAAMTIVAVAIVIFPIVRRPRTPMKSGSEVAFYTAQLAEIARDVERGQLPPTEATAARAETGRKLLAARASGQDAETANGTRRSRWLAAGLVALVAPTIGIGLYARFGEPSLPDAPLSALEAAMPDSDPVAEALARVEAEATASPDNEKPWAALAPVYIRLGRYNDAIKANRNLLRIKGEDGTLRANLGEAEVAAAGGKVTPQARADFEKALAESPDSVIARFYLGLAAEQAGDTKTALAAYEPLIEESQDHPHWLSIIHTRIAALKGANAPAAMAPAAPAAPASAGLPDSQRDMVNAMVSRLATRLAQSGGGVDDWLQLIRSYAVLDAREKASDALAAARKALGADKEAAARLDSLAQEFNLGPR